MSWELTRQLYTTVPLELIGKLGIEQKKCYLEEKHEIEEFFSVEATI